MSIDIKQHCNSCGADFKRNSLEENLQLMKNCTNCIADIMLSGNWTGVGHNIMTKLIEKHGVDVVRYTNQKLEFERM